MGDSELVLGSVSLDEAACCAAVRCHGDSSAVELGVQCGI